MIEEDEERKVTFQESNIELKVEKKNKKKNILVKVDELFDQINRMKEEENECMFPIIDNVQKRQFQYSKYRTEVLSNSCNKDNLILTKVLSSMPLYKQEKIYELKKQGLKNFAEKQFRKVSIKKQEQPILKRIGDYSVQDQGKMESSIIYSDSEIITKGGLRMRSPDETLTFLKNNFGVVVRFPQKQRLRSRKELEEEERQIERDRRKQYNVKDKLEIYYTNIEQQVQWNKKNEEILKNKKSEEVNSDVEKEVRNGIFSRNLYYMDHYNGIKLGYEEGRERKIELRNQQNSIKSMNSMNELND